MKKAFTIVELMMVVGIIGILLSVLVTVAAGSIKQARGHKATACCTVVQQGLATYYAQKGKWPGSFGNKVANGNIQPTNTNDDPNTYNLTSMEIREIIRELVLETKQGNPMFDLSGLFVSRSNGSNSPGLDFSQAVRGTKHSPRKMKVAEMFFGCPDSATGKFREFKIKYSIPTDELIVQ